MRWLDRLNTPRVLFVVLALFLILDGLLFYRYQLLHAASASSPLELERRSTMLSSDTAAATDEEGGSSALQVEAAAQERDDEAGAAEYPSTPDLLADDSVIPAAEAPTDPTVPPTAAFAPTDWEFVHEGEPAYEEQYEVYYG